jgi:hypothetical protein
MTTPPATPEHLPEVAREILTTEKPVDVERLRSAIGTVATVGLVTFRRRVQLAHEIEQQYRPDPATIDMKHQQFIAAITQVEQEGVAGYTPGGVLEHVDKALYQVLPRNLSTQQKFWGTIGAAATAMGITFLWNKAIKPATAATVHGVATAATWTWGKIWTGIRWLLGAAGATAAVAGIGHLLGFWKVGIGGTPAAGPATAGVPEAKPAEPAPDASKETASTETPAREPGTDVEKPMVA